MKVMFFMSLELEEWPFLMTKQQCNCLTSEDEKKRKTSLARRRAMSFFQVMEWMDGW